MGSTPVQAKFLLFEQKWGGTNAELVFGCSAHSVRRVIAVWSCRAPRIEFRAQFCRVIAHDVPHGGDSNGERRTSSTSHTRNRAVASYFERTSPASTSSTTATGAQTAKLSAEEHYTFRFWIFCTTTDFWCFLTSDFSSRHCEFGFLVKGSYFGLVDTKLDPADSKDAALATLAVMGVSSHSRASNHSNGL